MEEDWAYWREQYLCSDASKIAHDHLQWVFYSRHTDPSLIHWDFVRFGPPPSVKIPPPPPCPVLEPPYVPSSPIIGSTRGRGKIDCESIDRLYCRTVVKFKRTLKSRRPPPQALDLPFASRVNPVALLEAPLCTLPSPSSLTLGESHQFEPSSPPRPLFTPFDLPSPIVAPPPPNNMPSSLLEPPIPATKEQRHSLASRNLRASMLEVPWSGVNFVWIVQIASTLEAIPKIESPSCPLSYIRTSLRRLPRLFGRPKLHTPQTLQDAALRGSSGTTFEPTLSEPTLFEPTLSEPTLAVTAHHQDQPVASADPPSLRPSVGHSIITKMQLLINRSFLDLGPIQESLLAATTATVVEREFCKGIPLLAVSASTCLVVLSEQWGELAGLDAASIGGALPFDEIHLVLLIPFTPEHSVR